MVDGLIGLTAPCTPEDAEFLFEVYASTRREEVAAWGWDGSQQEAFLRMQFQVQQRAYAMQYPDAEQRRIVLGDEPVGRLIVLRMEPEIRLVDISLLPAFRSRGIGTEVIRGLQAEAAGAGKVLRLMVVKGSPARRLYERLGFVQTGESGTHEAMEWHQPAPMLENLSLSDFAEHVNTRFQLRLDPSRSLEMELVEAADRGSTPRQEQFALLFRGPLELFLPQQMYRLKHAHLGEMDLFLVPVGRTSQGFTYEAFFNRLLGAPGHGGEDQA